MQNIAHAKALIDQGYSIIPLYRESKHNGDEQILERDYTLEHLNKPLTDKHGKELWHIDGNQGLNLEKSKLKDIDLENKWSIQFGQKWLDTDTLTLGRERPDGTVEITPVSYTHLTLPTKA